MLLLRICSEGCLSKINLEFKLPPPSPPQISVYMRDMKCEGGGNQTDAGEGILGSLRALIFMLCSKFGIAYILYL